MKFMIKPVFALATCLLFASCGSDRNSDANASLAAQPANTAVENTGNAPTTAPAAETFRNMQIAEPLLQNWMHLDPAFKAESNCIQLASQASSSRVLFAGSACPASGGITREMAKFELFSEVAASPLDGEIELPKTEPKIEQGKQAPQVQRFILKLQQKVAAPVEQGKVEQGKEQGKEPGKEPEQGKGKEEPKVEQQGKMNLVELAVGEYEIRTIQEKVVTQKPVQQGQGQKPAEEQVESMVERTEIVLTHLCTGEYADDCVVAFENGLFKSIALTEHGLSVAKTIGEGLAIEKNPQPKVEEPKAEPKAPQVEPKKEEPKVEPKEEPKAEPKVEPKKEEPKQPQTPQAPQNPEKPKDPKGE